MINELRQVIREVRQIHPFTIDAWVLLPDHMHCVWTLPQGDDDYSKRMGMIKARFTSRITTKLQKPGRITVPELGTGKALFGKDGFGSTR